MKYFVLFLFLNLTTFGQTKTKIYALQKEIKQTKSPLKKAKLHLKISKLLENKNRDSSKFYAKKAEIIAITIANKEVLSNSYLQQGILFYKQKKDDTALQFFNKIDSLYTLDNKITESYIMSKIYRAEISKFTFTMPGVLQAKQYILQALSLAKEINSQKLIHLAKYRLGEWHGFMSQAENPKQHIDTAKIYIKKVLKYYQKQKDYEFIARVYYTMASINIAQKDYKTAELNYKKRLHVIKKSNDSVKIAEAYYGLGSIYRNFKQPNKGLIYLDSAATIFKKTGFSTDGRRKNLYRDYAYLYELKKDYKNAFENMRKAIVFKDTLYEEQNNKIAMDLEKKYQTKQKEQEIKVLKIQNKLTTQQKKNQSYLFFGALILSSLLGLFFYIQYKNRKKIAVELQKLDEVKSTLFANISHEFRTPLTLISGPIQNLLKKETHTKETKNYLKLMERNSNRLLSLVNQLLDISKIESGTIKLQLTNANIFQFTSILVEGFSFSAKEKELHFTFNPSSSNKETWFDKDLTEKIIGNLINNAIKYTPKKGSIICNSYIEESIFHFTIKNTGNGLNKEEMHKIFERFYQINKDNQGVGIGLSLVKDLVTLHKGSINVKSSLHEWTSFHVKLPINKEAYNKEDFSPNWHSNSLENKEQDAKIYNNISNKEDKPILLIVDDSADIRDYITSIFNTNYFVLKAKNGLEGTEIAIEKIPDIIISDIRMPIKNGIELCNTLKQDERTSHIPIILLTAKTGNAAELEGVESGADDYMTKPFNENLLLKKAENLIKSRKKLQERYSQEVILKPTDIAINSLDEQFLEKIQKIIDTDITDASFTIEAFGNTVGMSRMQLHRKLKALFGMSTTAFIRSQRLKLAAELLKKSKVTVSQIGYSVGFNDHAYFSKRFKEIYHCTPSEYANKFNK